LNEIDPESNNDPHHKLIDSVLSSFIYRSGPLAINEKISPQEANAAALASLTNSAEAHKIDQ